MPLCPAVPARCQLCGCLSPAWGETCNNFWELPTRRSFSVISIGWPPGARGFIYCDPPYDGTFTGYDSQGFSESEQRRLRDAALKWYKLGAAVMVPNADTELIRSLYSNSPFTLHEVSAPRNINCDGIKRGHAAELLITTYA